MLKNTGLRFLWIAILLIAIDRLAKVLVLSHLSYGEPFVLLPIFNLTLVFNTGAAFSFLSAASGWQTIFLGSLAAIVSVVLIIFLARTPANERWQNIAINLILGGAIGNAWDRVLYGHVIDFFDFHINTWHFAVFNTADSFICIGAFMLLISWIKVRNSS